ncbi:MAG: FGGY family carbohydrate kinase, partial [Bacillales bacterium]|nr:FGGY family carbohydrate kinase [Bacillales bacterium]
MKTYIGIDLGTSGVKLLLLHEDGKILNIVTKDYPIFYRQKNHSSQNPEDWFCQTIEGLKELLINQN